MAFGECTRILQKAFLFSEMPVGETTDKRHCGPRLAAGDMSALISSQSALSSATYSEFRERRVVFAKHPDDTLRAARNEAGERSGVSPPVPGFCAGKLTHAARQHPYS